MRNTSIALVAVLLGTLSACSSTSSGGDGGDDGGTAGAPGGDAATTDGPVLYGLSTGESCFDIVAVATNTSDGCDIGVDAEVNHSIKVNYDMTTATVTLGTDGSLGAGMVINNMGTLTRDSTATDPGMTTCTWHQVDTSMITLTDTNTFTAAISETESMFATECNGPPATGTCTSTWTWMLKKSTTFTYPNCN